MIISKAPVRLSLGGGGTDLQSYYKKYGGFVMSCAINKYVYIMLNRRFEESTRISYSKTEIVDDIKDIEHNIFREALKYLNVTKHLELVSIADVPSNCGLGTSSVFTVSLLNSIFNFKNEFVPLNTLAEIACHIEIEILKEPIGKQDQYSAAFGGFNAYHFNTDGTVEIEPVCIPENVLYELHNNIILFYLNKKRSASEILSDQNIKSIENNRNTIERLHKIKEIGIYTKKIFENGNIDGFGEILHNHWMTKKGLSDKISNEFIDEVYNLALKNGALGGKVIGAGGGGFILFYCPRNKQKLVDTMAKFDLKPMWFSFEKEGAKILLNN